MFNFIHFNPKIIYWIFNFLQFRPFWNKNCQNSKIHNFLTKYDNFIKLVSKFSQKLILLWKIMVGWYLFDWKFSNGGIRTGGYFCSLHNKNDQNSKIQNYRTTFDNWIKLGSKFSQKLIFSWKIIVDICLIEKNSNRGLNIGGKLQK